VKNYLVNVNSNLSRCSEAPESCKSVAFLKASGEFNLLEEQIFYDRSTKIPSDGSPQIYINIPSDSMSGKLLIVGIFFNLISVVIFALFFFRFKYSKATRLAMPLLLCIRLIGFTLLFLSSWFYLGEVSSFACHARIWFQIMGYLFVVSPLMIKCLLLHNLCNNNPSMTKYRMNMLIAMIFVSLVAIEIVIITQRFHYSLF
jgi:hypothetical protein